MSTLQIVLIALGAALILFWLIFALRKPRAVDVPDVLVTLRYGSGLRIAALILAWTPAAVLMFVAWRLVLHSDNMLIAAGVSFAAMSLLAGLLLIEADRVQIAVSETGVTRHSPWTGRASLAWSEIERIEYSALNRWF